MVDKLIRPNPPLIHEAYRAACNAALSDGLLPFETISTSKRGGVDTMNMK